ncbi:MAG: hypothetical protein WCH98_09960 [Verrucomicrobiota bacterium]
MKPGTDFEIQPFATFETDALLKGDIIEIPGFEDAVRAWQNGSWENYGFLITLSGPSMQVSVSAREAAGR